MNTNLTDITLVVDRSGSMFDVQQDAEGGVNSFLEEQAKEPGEALLTLVQFDTEYEFLHRGVPIRQVPRYTLVPRGSTALFDAVGRAINETGRRLSNMPEADRPGLVVFVVVTDGMENASREFTLSQVREMIQRQQTVYNWQFNFLGAGPGAFAEGVGMGIDPAGVASYTTVHVAAAYSAANTNVARMRSQNRRKETVHNAFTASERAKMK